MSETTVDVSPTRIPVGQGHLNLGGQVFYRPGPLWLRVNRGVIAESIRLTPEMTNRWLKYLAPLAADTTRIDGIIGAEIDEGLVVLEQPEKSRVSGRLNIAGAEMTAGPLVNQILGGVDPLRSLARAAAGQPAQPPQPLDPTLISMPAQTVGFSVDRGVVSHDRLFFEAGNVQVVTSGRVALDGRLDMVAQVPLDARWLGSDLQQLAGQPVTLPIDGTLSRPSLDSSGVRQVAEQFGTQAVEATVEKLPAKAAQPRHRKDPRPLGSSLPLPSFFSCSYSYSCSYSAQRGLVLESGREPTNTISAWSISFIRSAAVPSLNLADRSC